jgi:hypothetical protein
MRLIIACVAWIGPVSSAFGAETMYRCANGTAVQAVFSAPGPTGSVRLTFARQRRLCVPKIRFCNIDREGRQGQVLRLLAAKVP